jgi:hypothetical protein
MNRGHSPARFRQAPPRFLLPQCYLSRGHEAVAPQTSGRGGGSFSRCFRMATIWDFANFIPQLTHRNSSGAVSSPATPRLTKVPSPRASEKLEPLQRGQWRLPSEPMMGTPKVRRSPFPSAQRRYSTSC